MNTAEKCRISIVVPVFNERENIEQLFKELLTICRRERFEYEIIIVDDGSTDGTREVLRSLSPLTYIRLRRNFGQTAALDAGLRHAHHRYIVTMDGDGQNDPADIPRLVSFLEKNNLDVVSGWRRNRKDPWLKKFVSRGAHILRRVLINDGIHDSGCTLKVYRKHCFEQVHLYGDMHRFIPALLRIKGFQVGELEVNHRLRAAGKTKYNWSRTLKGFIDMFSVWFWHRYSVRPLHLLGGLGLFCFTIGGLFSLLTIFLFMRNHDLSNTVWPLLSVFFLLTGIQLFVSGLLSDIVAKNYYETTVDRSYSIEEIVHTK